MSDLFPAARRFARESAAGDRLRARRPAADFHLRPTLQQIAMALMTAVPPTDSNLRGGFPETRPSALQGVQGEDEAVRTRAVETIVSVYWKPVYEYIRLRWRAGHEDAEDLTQGFFARAIEKDFFRGFEAGRARFRTYLRVCLDRFIANARQAQAREKRGGGALVLSLEADDGREALGVDAAPDEAFDREWVRSLFTLAIGGLRAEYDASGKSLQFALFAAYDLEAGDAGGADGGLTYADLGRVHGISATTVTNYLAAARRDFRRIVLAKLREITATEEEFRAEAILLFRSSPPPDA